MSVGGDSVSFRGTHSWEIFDVVPPERLSDAPTWFTRATPDPRPPRPAATVVPLREWPGGLRVWMMRRRPELVFGGAWVFPGGKVDPEDEHDADPLIACAIRETAEEAGITLAAHDLVPWAQWITPVEAPARFDTHFFVAALPAGVEPVNTFDEADEAGWFDLPTLIDGSSEDFRIISPTRAVLHELALLGSWEAIRAAARTRIIEPVLARWVTTGDSWRVSHPRRNGTWT